MNTNQELLSQDQIKAFYHDLFVDNQVKDFIKLVNANITNSKKNRIIDIGGGCGFFAKAIQSHTELVVEVLDSDNYSVDYCKKKGIKATIGDALNPNILGDESIVCFNLILHHLVGKTATDTLKMQKLALTVWDSYVDAIFINEYIYDSHIINNISGWLIYQITSNNFLSLICKFISKFAPSLEANTFGVGVRFRSHNEWCKLFESIGFEVLDKKIGDEEQISLPRRLLLIKSCRRDSFLLKPNKNKKKG